MKRRIPLPKSELQKIKDDFKAVGITKTPPENFDYDKTQLNAEYDMIGNILFIETNNIELNKLLKRNNFID